MTTTESPAGFGVQDINREFNKDARKLVPVTEVLFRELEKSATTALVTDDEIAQIAKQCGLTAQDVAALYRR